MLVKFFGNKKGGSSSAVNYLLNEREQLGTAKVLQGDPNITKDIINSIQRKQKVTVGCLSFEEKNIPNEQKYKLMKEFEEMLLPGLATRYNILWVEHTDKDRLELNFVIPKTDLETNKALQPHYYKEDQKRVELFQHVKNLEHGYTSPNDPSKTRNIEGATKQPNIQQDYEQLDKLLHNLVEEGTIKNREQLIGLLKENNIEVNRQGKDYISVKLPESTRAKRFKKGIYSEEFRSVGELGKVSKRTREEINEYRSRDTSKDLKHYQQELDKFTQYKLKANGRKYPRTNTREHELKPQTHSKSNSDTLSHDRKSNDFLSDERVLSRNSVERTEAPQIRNNKREEVSKIHPRGQYQEQQRERHTQIHSDKGLENDSVGTRAISRAKRTRETQQELISSLGTEGREVYPRFKQSYENIREQHQKDYERLRVPAGELEQEVRGLHEQRSNGISSFKGRVIEAYGHAKEYISNKVQEIARKFEEMKARELKAQEIKKVIRETEIERTPSRSRGFGYSR